MTRFGRDHVQVGMYMELFRKHGVRFIAIGHGIDSINPDSLEFAPFINTMSEWYSRDNSRKLRAVFKIKGNSGKRTTNHAIYGYKKDTNDRTKWIVDEEAAANVRRIYQMTIEGKRIHTRTNERRKRRKKSKLFLRTHTLQLSTAKHGTQPSGAEKPLADPIHLAKQIR